MASEGKGDSDDLRIVLLGVSGAGKSSIGNAILGREAFKESRTRQSEIQRGRVEDRNISIIDTPGFFNTHLTDEELQEQMMKSLDLCDPGPDVFLLVINLETFEEDEKKNIVEKIEEIFSVRALKITMVLFSGRELMSKKEWKNFKFGEKFEDLVSKCRAYHEINRNDESNQICIKNLLNKIEELIKQNDEQHFKSKVDSVSQKRKTKEKKKQVENSRIKEQEKGRQEQAMLETFEMNSTMEEGATLFEPEEFQLRKTTTDVCEDTVLQGMISLYGLSHERMGEENEVKTQEDHWKMRQKKGQTTEEKHLTQAGGSQYLALCFWLICVLLLVVTLQHIIFTAERDFTEFLQSPFQGVTHSDDGDGVRIVLLGKTGVGKSATGNTILRQETFKSLMTSRSVTRECQKKSSEFNGRQITVIDTPGLFDTGVDNAETRKETVKCISMVAPGPHVFLLVIPLGRFTQEEKDAVKMIQEMFGDQSRMYTMVLFTRGDDLRGTTIEEFIEENDSLQYLIQQCGHKYHVFNNIETENQTQVSELLEKIDHMVAANGGSFYTNEMFQQVEKNIREEQERILKEKEEQLKRKEEELRTKFEAEKEQIKKDNERKTQEMQNELKKKEDDFKKREEEIKNETDENVRKELWRELEEKKKEFEEKTKRKEIALGELQQNFFKHLEEIHEKEKQKLQKKIQHETREQAEREYLEKLKAELDKALREAEEKHKTEMAKALQRVKEKYDTEMDQILRNVDLQHEKEKAKALHRKEVEYKAEVAKIIKEAEAKHLKERAKAEANLPYRSKRARDWSHYFPVLGGAAGSLVGTFEDIFRSKSN